MGPVGISKEQRVTRDLSPRVRRHHKLPRTGLSRCIESAQTHRARAGALPARASDTTLGLLARNSFRVAVLHYASGL